MDILSLIGLVLAACAILIGAILKGAGIQSLLSGAAFMIVVVGTIAAICIQTPLHVMKRALSILPWVFTPPTFDRERDDFVRKGLQLVVDGSEPEIIRSVMEVDLHTREQADTRAAKVFEGMGIYAPTLGIIGAVLGLMAVMQNLADPAKLGHGIAAAFVATIYGIGFANLFFLPVASKLKVSIQGLSQTREMVIEGMISIAQGENPRSIEAKLQGYLH